MNEMYGPIIQHGISQTFDYGIGMTCISLCLIASVALNIFFTWIFSKAIPLIIELKKALKP